MLAPKQLTAFDEATALGIAALWNDAIPTVLHTLDHHIADLEEAVNHAHTCDRNDCQRTDVRHNPDEDDCACYGCENFGLSVMAQDARHWLARVDEGTGAQWEYDPDALLGRLTTWLYVNNGAPKPVPSYRLGAVYRLVAELADQTNAKFAAMAPGQS